MKKRHFKVVSSVLVAALLQLTFSPFIFRVYAKGSVSISGEAGKAQVTVNGKSFPLKTGLQIKDGVHIIRLKKDLFTSVGINYSEWDENNTVFVGLKSGGNQVILEIKRGQKEIRVKHQGKYVELIPEPYLDGPNVFVPLEPVYEMLGFSVSGAPAKIVEKQKPKTEKTPVLQPGLLFETATLPKVKVELLPASGKIKKLTQSGQTAITLDTGTGAKVGEILYITRDEMPVATVKVIKAGAGWCVAKILSVEKDEKVRPGDGVSVTKPEVVKIPTQPEMPVVVTPEETKPEIPSTPVVEEETTKEPEKKVEEVVTVPVAAEEIKKKEETKPEETKKQSLDEIIAELQGKKTEAETSAPVEKKKLAVMGFENLSKLRDVTLSKKALDTVTEALHATQRFILVEREQIGVALLELNLHQTEFFKPENAKKIGEFLGADLIGVGSIKSVSQLGKTGALVELSLRIFETETGKLLYSLSAVGKSEGEGSSDYHTGQALQRASNFISQKLPGEVTASSAITGMTEVTLGLAQGIKNGQELAVVRDGKEIGKVVVKNVRSMSAEGTFTAYNKGATLKQGDQVLNPAIKDDTPPKKKKGGMSSMTMILGAVLLGALAGLAGGGGGGSDGGSGTTSSPAIAPPGPPE